MQDDILTSLEKAELHDHNYATVIGDLKVNFGCWKSNQVIYLIGMVMCGVYACFFSLFVSSHLWIILGIIAMTLLAISGLSLHHQIIKSKHNLNKQIAAIRKVAKKEA